MAWRGMARHGEARQGTDRGVSKLPGPLLRNEQRGRARRCEAWPGTARLGEARRGVARQGKDDPLWLDTRVDHYSEMSNKAGRGTAGPGTAWRGEARLGKARRGKARAFGRHID